MQTLITPDSDVREEGPRRRVLPMVWIASLVGAIVLALGVNGTLSAWSTAIIETRDNTAGSADAVRLQLFEKANYPNTPDCDTGSDANNELTGAQACSSVNQYGGTATKLEPGGTPAVVDVVLANKGTANGNLTLDAAACTAINGDASDLCGQLTITVTCSSGSNYSAGPVTLNAFTGMNKPVATNVAVGGSVECKFTVALPADTPSQYAGLDASQVLTWKLVKAV